MRRCAVGLAWIALLLLSRPVAAQSQAPSEKLLINARAAYIWSRGNTQTILLQGPLTITMDRATLTARQAVVWLTPAANGAEGQQHAEFALLGDATLKQAVGTRSGEELFVTAEVLGEGQITADQRVARDMSNSPLYRRAEELRRRAATVPTPIVGTRPASPATGPASRPGRPTATQPAMAFPVHLEAGNTDIAEADDGTVAIVAWNGVKIVVNKGGDELAMQCQRAVLYTSLYSLRDLSKAEKSRRARELVTAVYLEGDVRIDYIPVKAGTVEQRMLADRVYYDLATDRAILVNAVLHTSSPQTQVPLIVNAKILRQLSRGEFVGNKVQLTSSAFAVPSYSIAADRVYVRSEATDDPQFPERVTFEANNATLRAFNVPFFYLPYAAGSVGDRPGPLRGLNFGHRTDLGYEALTEWGLFETLGQVPPRSIDAAYRVDYFTDRGPGIGGSAAYGGGFLTEPAHQPWNYMGDFKGYFVYDEGTDSSYGRLPVKPGGPGNGYVPRGYALFQDQHFFPDNWQGQLRLGYTSDPTFLEEWEPRQFYEDGPVDVSAYLKRQRDTDAFTLLVQAQPSRLVTYSDMMSNQFEVERVPEASYHRIGDSIVNNSMTLFSDNTAGGVEFQPTQATLAQQGFQPPNIPLGIRSLGQTGVVTSPTWRADFRQEVDWPVNAGHFKVVPYLVGRYTQYSQSPGGGQEPRFFGAAGARMTTSFWKIDPTAQSDLFDVHQMRHVIEPELNLFTAGTTVDRSRLFMYDSQIDAINDISAIDIALRQRWQTQRGGPGRWRSVDLFTLDLDAEFYANKPNSALFSPPLNSRGTIVNPVDFRGVFFSSLPETSIPRNSLNADASWRLSDTTVVLADGQYNLDFNKLATAAIGVLFIREAQQSLYVGNRYIADLNSNITSVEFTYQISPKYTLEFGQSFDFGLGRNVASSISVVRSFDRFMLVIAFHHQQIGNQTGVDFALIPIGMGNTGLSSAAVQGPFAGRGG